MNWASANRPKVNMLNLDRHCPEYYKFLNIVFVRDNERKRKGFCIHHIFPFTSKDGIYKQYRYDPFNGIVLSTEYHSLITHEDAQHFVEAFRSLVTKATGFDHSLWPTPNFTQCHLPFYAAQDIPILKLI